MNRVQIPVAELGAVVSGVLDVVFAFALALERAGLLDRAAIVDVLIRIKEQIAAQEGTSSKRGVVADLLLQALQLPATAADQKISTPAYSSARSMPVISANSPARWCGNGVRISYLP